MWALVHRPATLATADLFNPVWPTAKPPIEADANTRPAPVETKNDPRLLAVPSDILSPPLTPSISPDSSISDLRSLDATLPPLPMLTSPTYRVDISDRIFNYDCGL
jgi:hypothetical protein